MVADEDRTGVADPAGPLGRVGGEHLEVLGGPGVDDLQAVVEVVDQHVRGLAGQRGLDALAVPCRGDLLAELDVDRVEQLDARRDQQAGGERVVLGLRDEVGGDEGGDGGVVGQDADLGRAGLGVDAAAALHQALGRGDVDVARAGDDVDRAAVLRAVREHRDGLRAADRPHLVDAEQRARRQHDRVRQAVGLRRAGDGQAADARDQRRHDVHDHAARVGDPPARDVQPDPAHRHPALGDRRARRRPARPRRRAAARWRRCARGGRPPPARRAPPGRAARARRRAPRRAPAGAAARPRRSAASPRGPQPGAPVAHVLDDRPDLLQRRGDVQPRPAGSTACGSASRRPRRSMRVSTAELQGQGRSGRPAYRRAVRLIRS